MRFLSAITFLAIFVSPVNAHDARPLSITLVEQAAGIYRVVVRAPPTLESQNAPVVIWPENCVIAENAPLALALGSTSLIECAGGLSGQSITLEYPSFNPSLTTLFRLENQDGTSITTVMPPDKYIWQVPENARWQQVALDYTSIGIRHIWAGIDHLLFVAGLLLLARTPRRIVLAITGFTIAHSITLSLATFQLVRVPVSLVEALIALSIVFLAGEIARSDNTSFSHRYPVVLSFVFGLLHGFGFASALGETGLVARELVTGLLFFNIGVELGQLGFIAFLLLLTAGLRKVTLPGTGLTFKNPLWPTIGAYCLGIPAAYWFMERSFPVYF